MAQKGVFLIDDHLSFRKGIRSILEKESLYNIVGEAGDGREALEKISILEDKIEILLVDISLPDTNGMELIEKIKEKYSNKLMMVVSMHSSEEYILLIWELTVMLSRRASQQIF